ncbi:MAG: archease [Halodesulfurarchaeum sp.]
MSYELRDHTADVAVAARAVTLGGVFAATADGMAEAMAEDVPAETGTRFDVEERAESLEALLFEYLDRLIYERDVREVLPVDNEATVEETDDGWRLTGSARGIPLSEVAARDLKAVTYSQMEIREEASGWFAYVVFDV